MVSKSERLLEPALVQFGESFVKSDGFKALFRDGMALIEEAAAYLDGDGRDESSRLGRQMSVAYAGESMRLTTRLMQIASWLLVQRAVSEGEITSYQARREKDRVKLVSNDRTLPPHEFEALPERLRDLIAGSYRLHARVAHLDRLVMGEAPAPVPALPRSPLALQRDLLASAFGAH